MPSTKQKDRAIPIFAAFRLYPPRAEYHCAGVGRGTNGIITTLAGNGVNDYTGDGGQANKASLNYPLGAAVDAAGNDYIADSMNNRVRVVTSGSIAVEGTVEGDVVFSDEDGLLYVMSAYGLHKKTVDMNTGVTLYEFAYDDNDNLVSVTDRMGNRIVIERNGGGLPTAIVSPDGVRTGLTIDSAGFLTCIEYPDNGHFDFDYTADGLMTSKTESNGNRFGHDFDSTGML